ncbi:MAG: hypothetical protein IPK66_01840 [Rhodospirillales bacterium]|nr:hypothetical protein [Rhodospirillales bacterium]
MVAHHRTQSPMGLARLDDARVGRRDHKSRHTTFELLCRRIVRWWDKFTFGVLLALIIAAGTLVGWVAGVGYGEGIDPPED